MVYDMTKKAIEMGLYTQAELITLRDTRLDLYLGDGTSGDISQAQYDELMLLVIAAIVA